MYQRGHLCECACVYVCVGFVRVCMCLCECACVCACVWEAHYVGLTRKLIGQTEFINCIVCNHVCAPCVPSLA